MSVTLVMGATRDYNHARRLQSHMLVAGLARATSTALFLVVEEEEEFVHFALFRYPHLASRARPKHLPLALIPSTHPSITRQPALSRPDPPSRPRRALRHLHGPILRVVKVLLWYPAAHERGLGAADVNVLEEVLGRRLGGLHLLGLGDLGVDVRARVLVDGLELVLGRDAPVEQFQLEARNGVLCAAHALDFFARLRGRGLSG